MNIIYERSLLAATDTDVLGGGRLNAIPYQGILTFRFQADLANATNFWTLTIQDPKGDVPVDAQLVPGNNPALAGVIDTRTLLSLTFPTGPTGGHWVVSLTESGTALCTFEAVLSPAR